MATGSLDLATVTLSTGQMKMSQQLNMILFDIVDWNMGKANFANGKNGMKMDIVMKRKITSEMMTTYFPSLLPR
jgi:N-acetylglutamate synthase/N-acetylornithine aminotransferase